MSFLIGYETCCVPGADTEFGTYDSNGNKISDGIGTDIEWINENTFSYNKSVGDFISDPKIVKDKCPKDASYDDAIQIGKFEFNLTTKLEHQVKDYISWACST